MNALTSPVYNKHNLTFRRKIIYMASGFNSKRPGSFNSSEAFIMKSQKLPGVLQNFVFVRKVHVPVRNRIPTMAHRLLDVAEGYIFPIQDRCVRVSGRIRRHVFFDPKRLGNLTNVRIYQPG